MFKPYRFRKPIRFASKHVTTKLYLLSNKFDSPNLFNRRSFKVVEPAFNTPNIKPATCNLQQH